MQILQALIINFLPFNNLRIFQNQRSLLRVEDVLTLSANDDLVAMLIEKTLKNEVIFLGKILQTQFRFANFHL